MISEICEGGAGVEERQKVCVEEENGRPRLGQGLFLSQSTEGKLHSLQCRPLSTS